MGADDRVLQHYEAYDEDARLWSPGLGTLVRLRTWDIFARYLPRTGDIADVGGGPGTHAEHLASRGYAVTLVDPSERHVARARERSGPDSRFEVRHGDAQALPLPNASADAVLLMGPLYHLVDRRDRIASLMEARRVMRPGGTLIAEVICRHTWILDATRQGLLDVPDVWDSFDTNIRTGLSQDPHRLREGVFFGYFHRMEDLTGELGDAGFADVRLVAVEGFAWLLGNLERRLERPEPLLDAIRLTEEEPSMLGASAHVVAVASMT